MNNLNVTTELQNDNFLITLNRPDKSNSYDYKMAEEIKEAFILAGKSSAKLILLKANGKNFCAGADLEWMKKATTLSPSENLADMTVIKDMFLAILAVEIPIIGYIQGSVRGGGLGLVALCDIAICEDSATFSLSEAKWGLIPGIITPLVIQKIGASRFLELALSSRIFNFNEALAINLVHHKSESLDFIIKSVLENSVSSTKLIKKIVTEDFLSYQSLNKMLIASSELRLQDEFRKEN